MRGALSRWAAALVLGVGVAAWGGWPDVLPGLRLPDQYGTEFADEPLKARGVVLVVTAPIAAQGDAQRAWHDALGASAADKSGPAVAMLEDMSQSWFRPMVVAEMKRQHPSGAPILLLLDESGATRKAFGVAENATVAFAFAPGGKLVAVETGPASPERALKLLHAARKR